MGENVEKEQYPKVLIISHNLYDVNNNIGKTLVSLFKGWPKEKLSQIYFRNDMPSFNYCKQYYCITDKEIFFSALYAGRKKAGNCLYEDMQFCVSEAETNLYSIGNKRKPIVSLIRDMIWNIGNWKNEKLDKWLKEVSPDIILFVPNDYCLAYNVALYVEKVTKKRIIPFYMDDSFYYNCKTTLIDYIRRRKLRKLASCVHNYSDKIFTICDYMSEEYQKRFHKKCFAFMNSVNIETKKKNSERVDPYVISYLGNLHSNRWESIVEVGLAIDNIVEKYNKKIEFRIYSGSLLDKSMKKSFDKIKSIRFMGRIEDSQVREKQLQSDMLVHVEAFDRKSVNSTRLSLSTKIPEYLSSGVCVFAYGPASISSIKYLKEYNLAQVCSNPKEIEQKLYEIIFDADKRKKYIENGVQCVNNKHNIAQVALEFQKLIIED